MIKEELFRNKRTGEIVTGSHAIKEFYKTHNGMESWTDEYLPTGSYSDEDLSPPDFTKVMRKK